MIRTLALCLAALSATACASQRERLAEVGRAPAMRPMEDPSALYGRQPVMMPMPEMEPEVREANSLWREGGRAFFGDPRASRIGDIVTVAIEISDRAQLSNSTSRSRTSSEDAGLDALLGLENLPGAVLPGGFTPGTAADFDSASSTSGQGGINRSETIELTVAAIVTDVLPNGNFVVAGRQEVRINHEVRELLVTGIVRPEDISSQNTISHTQIAEARISYGGRGVLTDVQQPRYGQQVYEILFPF